MQIEYRYHTEEHVHYYTGKVYKHTASLTKKELEWWLRKNHRLEYTVTTTNGDSAIFQMSLDEWLDGNQEDISQAITLFLQEKLES
jgi:hypothetical protein